MQSDTSFWWAVGALAMATLLLTLHHGSPELAGPASCSRGPGAASCEAKRDRASDPGTVADSSSARHMASADGLDRSPAASAATSAAHDPSPERRARQAAARDALAELVRASRERRKTAAQASGTGELDPHSRMPLSGMSFEQYRIWAKLGSMIAERDYRAVAEHEPPLSDVFDESTVDAMVDAIAEDYERYLVELAERACAEIEPSSVWRKTAFMALWLGRMGRHSAELASQEQEALRACGYG